jgi:hypothetical protein
MPRFKFSKPHSFKPRTGEKVIHALADQTHVVNDRQAKVFEELGKGEVVSDDATLTDVKAEATAQVSAKEAKKAKKVAERERKKADKLAAKAERDAAKAAKGKGSDDKGSDDKGGDDKGADDKGGDNPDGLFS